MSDTDIRSERLDVLKKNGRLTLTDSQKHAVLAKGQILVSAAAGSGKTSTMVQRIMLMVSEGTSMRDMLVLVYNTAAADELRERLHTELFEKVCSSRGEQRERFRRELDDLPFCKICTIHAFCSALIRDNFDKLSISPSFEVLDEQAHAVYMREALDAVFDEYSKNDDALFGEIAEIFSQSRKEDNLRANVIKMRALIDIQPDRQGFYSRIKSCFSSFDDSDYMRILRDSYAAYFEEAESKLESNAELLEATSLEKYKTALNICVSLCRQMKGAASFREMCAIAAEYQKPDLGKRVKIEEFEKRISDVYKSYFDDISDEAQELTDLLGEWDRMKAAHAQNAVYIDKILEITERFDEELNKLKQQDNVLSFEDLQHLAVKLLSDHPDFGDEYEAVFVDEYQDVNPTQEFIISRLVRGECFMVGDVKQSIYGFRLADPKIFLSRQESYKNGGGTAIDFNRNFRSARAILEFVNGVFDIVMTKKSADVDYKNTSAFELDGTPEDGLVQVHLFTDKKAERKVASGPYDITLHEQADEDTAASKFEGRYIAGEIRSLVGRAVTDGRRMSYGDIAILFRSRSKGASLIIEQLKSEGIPVDESVFGRAASSPERELIEMLRVLDNPRQDIPLAGFLLSFFGGYREEELARIAAEEGDCLYEKLLAFADRFAGCADENSDDALLARRLRETLSQIEAYRLKASFKNVSELMGGIVSDFCYDAYLATSSDADVYGLKSFIASAAAQDGKSLGKFLDEYSETDDNGASSGGGDRVHISTFHGFKGLEIPVVFVADAGYGFNYEAGTKDMSMLGGGYIGLNYFDFDNKFKYRTLSKLAVAKLNRQERIKEEMRLFYVALTRAKQMMYITASVSAKKSGEFGMLDRIGGASCNLDFISAAIFGGGVDVSVFRHSADGEEQSVADNTQRVLPADEKIVAEIERVRQFVYPYKTATKLAMKYSVSALDRADEPAINVYDEGAATGILYHKVMQFIDLFAEGEDGVRRELDRLKDENILTAEESALIDVGVIERCLASDIIALARRASLKGRCLREQPFMMYKPAREVSSELDSDDKILVQGIVDMYIDTDVRALVDFKYSRMDDKMLIEKYKTQLYLYKTAIEGAIGAKIDRTVIYSFRTGAVLDIEV